MKFELKPVRRNIPESELLDDLKKIASVIGKTPTEMEYDEQGKFSYATLKSRFGTWNKALSLAGLEIITNSPNITEEELFLNLEEVWTKIGRQPTSPEMKKPLSKYSRETYKQRYGTWNKALEKFVESINNDSENPEKEEEIIREEEKTLSIPYKHKTKREISWRLRFQVLARDSFRCVSCGLSPATALGTILHVDHVLPWSKGGETVMENLQTLCATCNLGKGNIEQ